MNILFITEIEPCSLFGGASRITYSVSRILEERGHRCFVAFSKAADDSWKGFSTGKVQFGLSNVRDVFERVIRDEHIDFIINNLVSQKYKKAVLPVLYGITRRTGTSIISCYHAMPGEELAGNTIRNIWYRIKMGYDVKRCLKDLCLGLIPKDVMRFLFAPHFKRKYRLLYNCSDKVVLLSERFRDSFMKLANLKEGDKLCSIHNVLSFNYFLPIEQLGSKGREILVLSRMDEKSKRISRVLKIWKMVTRDNQHKDWSLTVVGGGIDIPFYTKMAEKYRLERITFTGWQEDSIPYLERASIFMMTSAYEGWGLTITESQQYGIVPIVFDSYPSLHDIIEDGSNGVIVKDKDYDGFYRKLVWLMDNDGERMQMAREAIASTHRFSTDIVFKEWMALFDSLKN